MFTKITAGLPHRRWGRIELSDKKRAIIYLDLLELWKKKSRWAIIVEMKRKWLSPSSIDDTIKYMLE